MPTALHRSRWSGSCCRPSTPAKVACCRQLLRKHQGQGVLLFFEELLALQWYARTLQLPTITGSTSLQVQTQLLRAFGEGRINRLAFSRAGDTSLDLPRATTVIQISSHHGSRRQEVQRLGRISRIAPGKAPSRFYTLISEGTKEAEDTVRRPQYPTEQGYPYDIEQAELPEHVPTPDAVLAAVHAAAAVPPPPPVRAHAVKKTLRQRLALRK